MFRARSRRQPRARQVRRRLILATSVAVVASLLFGVGALDGGSATRPAGAQGRSRGAAVPGALHATRLPLRVRLARMEARSVERVLQVTPYVAVAGRRRREIALTFDDGPGPYTVGVVRVLQRMHVPATFFQVGFSEHWFTGAERALLHDPAFVLGDHTERHLALGSLGAGPQQAQIDQQAAVLRAAGAPAPRLFRPPYGSFDHATFAALAKRHMLMVLWTVDSQDYLRPGVTTIARRTLAGARPGAIVLMHDAGGDRSQTIAALPRIIRALRARHYRLVTVPRLLRDDPPSRRQPPIAAGVD